MYKKGPRGLHRFHFVFCKVNTRRGGNAVPLYLQCVFIWTLGSYSILVIGYCPLFKYSLYYVIIINMAKQKLSLTAKKAKAKRDLERAKRKDRKDKKAENQRKRRAAKKKGKNIKGKDFDHKDRKFKSVKKNRGNDGKGTKREGKKKYRTSKS